MQFTGETASAVIFRAADRRGPFEDLPVAQARRVRRAWDEASAMLTAAGLPATFDTVCALVAAGEGHAAKHARGLIARALDEGAR
ncbi:MAG: hypothetical protein WCJ30_25985 [Deltaproteobacteria bacterium]